jgi:hypothetical protein
MSRIGVVWTALAAAAWSAGAAPPAAPYEAMIVCGFEVRALGQSYGIFGDPSPITYRCVPVEVPKAATFPPMPDGVKADPTVPSVRIDVD